MVLNGSIPHTIQYLLSLNASCEAKSSTTLLIRQRAHSHYTHDVLSSKTFFAASPRTNAQNAALPVRLCAKLSPVANCPSPIPTYTGVLRSQSEPHWGHRAVNTGRRIPAPEWLPFPHIPWVPWLQEGQNSTAIQYSIHFRTRRPNSGLARSFGIAHRLLQDPTMRRLGSIESNEEGE